MSLAEIRITPKNITQGIKGLRQMNTLKTIGIDWKQDKRFPPEEFWKKYDAKEFSK
jgi:hypothetical protein